MIPSKEMVCVIVRGNIYRQAIQLISLYYFSLNHPFGNGTSGSLFVGVATVKVNYIEPKKDISLVQHL